MMPETFQLFSAIATSIFIEAMPFLIIGALFSAAIEVFVSTDRLLRYIPKSMGGGLILGIFAGFFLPTCECGVVPIVRRLVKKGVPPFIAIAYMLAAPIVNPVVLASTYFAFRGNITFVLARIVLAVVVAGVLGFYTQRLGQVVLDRHSQGENKCHGHNHDHAHDHHHEEQSFLQKIRSLIVHAGLEFLDMGKFLIIGALCAAIFKILLPETIMTILTSNLLMSIAGMMILAILLSICSEADAFVAASFQAFPDGAKLAFVGIGPMVDLKLIGMYAVTFRRRMVFALVLGPSLLIFILSWIFEQTGILSV